MAGEAYPKRWPAGFVDNDTSKYADAQFLNNAEAALLRLLGADPIDQGVQVWDAGLGRMKSIKLTNSQIDPAAAIDKSKLAALNIVDADISGAAGIAKSKLNLNGAITNADIQAAAAILGSKLQFSAGTSPPGSPATGDFWFYEDVANNVYWMFRYNAAQATYKWEFIGGSAMSHEILTQESTASTTYVDLTTVGPTLTVPRAGDYEITFGVAGFPSVGAAQVFVSPKLGAAVASDADDIRLDNTASTVISAARTIKRTLAASDVVKLQYRVNTNTGNFFNRLLFIKPVRVS